MQRGLALLTLGITACRPSAPQEARPSDLPIDRVSRSEFPPVIMYHEVREDKALNHFDVLRADFEAQLDWLQSAGYATLSLREYEAAVGSPLAKKAVLITFDDAYAGNFSVAAPLLRARNMKAVFFSHVGLVGSRDIAHYPLMTWQELGDLDRDPLFEVQSHTVSHPDLTVLSQDELQEELRGPRKILFEHLGNEPQALAYPMGKYNEKVIAATQAAGYRLAFAVFEKGDFGKPTRFSIPRIYMGTVMADLDLFSRCVQTYGSIPAACFEERWKPVELP